MKKNLGLKRLKYRNEWGKDITDEETKKKLNELSSLIGRISIDENSLQSESAFKLRKDLFTYLSKGKDFDRVTILVKDKLGENSKPIVILDEMLIRLVIGSFYNHLRIIAKKPQLNGRRLENFTKLLNIGGYKLIKELQKIGLSQAFIVDFMRECRKTIIETDEKTIPKKMKSVVDVRNVDAFKTAISDFKKRSKSKKVRKPI
jgi:hypothetical protein